MEDSCFVCPIYMKERDYKYAIEMIESKIKYNIEERIFFVFSYDEHMKKFKEMMNVKFGIEYEDCILVPEEYLKFKCQVTVKKLYAVRKLKDNYKYIAVIDCECVFIKHIDATSVFREIWESETFLVANKSYLLQHLLKKCVNKLKLTNKNRIKSETCTYDFNIWFNEIPIYNTEYADDFFVWLDSQNSDDIYNDYYMLDYYIYVLFLMDRYNYHIKPLDMWAPVGLMEEVKYTHCNECDEIEKKIGTHWTSNKESSNEKAFMLFHRDHIASSKQDIEELMSYSRYKYIFLKVFPSSYLFIVLFDIISKFIWRTEYYKKYRW